MLPSELLASHLGDPMSYDSERDLVIAAKVNPEAFGELYEKYVARIYNYHYRHT